MQVSLDVSRHKGRPARIAASSKCRPSDNTDASVNEIPEQPGWLTFAFDHEWASSSEVSCLLALRAGVLRRAGSWSGTTQKLRAEINASAASQGNQIARRTLSFVSNTPSTQFELMANECYTSLANMPGNMWSLRKSREATRTLHSAPQRKWLALC